MSFTLVSPGFAEGAPMPRRYASDGDDTSPPMEWSDPPDGTAAYALVMDETDGHPAGTFAHWVIFNIPGQNTGLPEGVPKTERVGHGTLQGKNDFGVVGYRGPQPPVGEAHRYRFMLYALDRPIEASAGASRQRVMKEVRKHTVGHAQMDAWYQR